jgi:hypothetical protein
LRTVRVHLAGGASFQVAADGALESGEVLPDFVMALADLFP